VAVVSFAQEGETLFETPPLVLEEAPQGRANAVSLRVSLPLEELPPGRYDCQVTIVDPSSQKTAVWQAPVVLIP
jgi:hypothetical protein